MSTDILSDVRTGLRQWRRRPTLPVGVVMTLTAGIGVAIGVFAVTWAVMWRPLEAPQPERLVWIESQSAGQADSSSPGAVLTWQDDARALQAVAAYRVAAGVLADAEGTDRLPCALVTESLFTVLGVRPALGRPFTASEDTAGASRVLLLSHGTWRSRYGSDPGVIGRGVALDGRAATIIGVLPPTAGTLLPDADWWAPLALPPSQRANVGARYLSVVGKLAASASPAAAQKELASIGARLGLEADDGSPLGVVVTPLIEQLTSRYRAGLVLLLAGVATLVLIACANVASLMLTRAQDRSSELALRVSLGASRSRIARQLFVEAAMLAGVSTVGGLGVALWITDLLRAVLPADVPRLAGARVDGVAAVFALGMGVLVTTLVGLMPAMRGARADLSSVLRDASTGSMADERARRAFVVAQVALAMVLACASALLLRSTQSLEQAPRGYDANGVLTASLTLPAAAYRDPDAIANVIDRVVRGVSTISGVTSAAAASQLPFAGGSAGSDVTLADEAFTTGTNQQVRVRLVGPGYLSALGVTLREGREVTAADRATSQPVVVVNETLARRLTPGGSPVGRDLKFALPVFKGARMNRVEAHGQHRRRETINRHNEVVLRLGVER